MKFTIPIFSGIQPKVAAHLLGNEVAQKAENCRLDSGEIRPLPRSALIEKMNRDGIAGLYYYDQIDTPIMLAFDVEIDAHRGFLAEDQYKRVYYTDDVGAKAWCEDDVAPGIFSPFKLGVPAPATTPTVVLTGSASGDTISTAYVFTLVSRHGEEGKPSPASDIIAVTEGNGVDLSNLNTPIVTGYNAITKKRIYRLNTGTSGSTEYQFVAEIDVVNTTYSDLIANVDLGEVIPSEDWNIPVDGLQGLVSMQGQFFAAFKGRDIYLTEPGYPHTMPHKYNNMVSHDIVGQGVSGNTLVILTKANAYVMDCTDIAYATPRRLDGSVSCVSKSGIVSTKYGVLYPSNDGLYLVQAASTSPECVTLSVFSKDDWEGFNPSTMRAYWYRGQYLCFYEKEDGSKYGFILELGSPLMVRTLGIHAVAGHQAIEGNVLYLAYENGNTTDIIQWESGSFTYKSEWKSKEFRTRNWVNMAAAKVEADYLAIISEEEAAANQLALFEEFSALLADGEFGGDIGGSPVGDHLFAGDYLDTIYIPYSMQPQVTFQLFGDGELRYTVEVSNDDPFLLPEGYEATRWEIVVSADIIISSVSFATSMQELVE